MDHILNKINELLKKKDLILVNIGGCSRSGKSFLASDLRNKIKSPSITISLDNFCTSIEERNGNDSLRFKYKYDEIVKATKTLKQGKEIHIPKYNHEKRGLEGLHRFQISKGVIFTEGVVALDVQGLREIADLNIYVDIPDHIRLMRSLNLYTKIKHIEEAKAVEILAKREEEEVVIVKESRQYANMIYRK